MSFRANVEIADQNLDVLYCSYEASRSTDEKGVPTTNVKAGRIDLKVESTGNTAIIEAMVNSQFKMLDGKITFKKRDEDAKMKELSFKNAYVVYYKEELDVNSERPMVTTFTLSAEEITVGNATQFNRWSLNDGNGSFA